MQTCVNCETDYDVIEMNCPMCHCYETEGGLGWLFVHPDVDQRDFEEEAFNESFLEEE